MGNGVAGMSDDLSSDGTPAGRSSSKKPAPRGRGGGALRAANAEAQAEASRALIGAGTDPNVNRATSPVHKRKASDLLVQVRGSETLDIGLFPLSGTGFLSCHSSYIRFACRRLLGTGPRSR